MPAILLPLAMTLLMIEKHRPGPGHRIHAIAMFARDWLAVARGNVNIVSSTEGKTFSHSI